MKSCLVLLLAVALVCRVQGESLVNVEKELGPEEAAKLPLPVATMSRAQSSQQKLSATVSEIVAPSNIGAVPHEGRKFMIAVSPEEAERIQKTLTGDKLNAALAANGLPAADAVQASIVTNPEHAKLSIAKPRLQQLSLKASMGEPEEQQSAPVEQKPVAAALPSPWIRGGAAATNVADFISALINKADSSNDAPASDKPDAKDAPYGAFSAGVEKAPPISPWMRGGAAASGLSSAVGWIVNKFAPGDK